jgi:hypothetical protein
VPRPRSRIHSIDFQIVFLMQYRSMVCSRIRRKSAAAGHPGPGWLAGWLAGCAGVPVERVVNVDTPVPVPCDVKTPQKPAMPLDALQAPYTGDQWTASAIAERKVRRAYEG